MARAAKKPVKSKKPAKTKAKAKPAPAKAAAPPTAAAKGSDVEKIITPKKFNQLVKDVESLKTQTGELSGDIGALVKLHVDKHHLEKKAFAIFRSLFRLSNKKLADTLPALLYYIDIGGLEKRATEQAEMFAEQGGDEGEAEDGGEEEAEGEADEQPEAQVSQPQFGRTRVARNADLAHLAGDEPPTEH